MKQQDTLAGRIVKNVNKVLEVIPRTLNSDAEVIKINFQKPSKAVHPRTRVVSSSKRKSKKNKVSAFKRKVTKAAKKTKRVVARKAKKINKPKVRGRTMGKKMARAA